MVERDETALEPRGRPERAGGESFLPHRATRPRIESLFVRLIATGGVIGAGVALAAILGSQEVDAWIIGLVVSAITVLLAAILWSSRTL